MSISWQLMLTTCLKFHNSYIPSIFAYKQGGKCRDISAIYRRYIVYREGSTRYFVGKNRKGDIFVNIAKISTIYRQYIGSGRYIGDFLKKLPLVAKYRRYIDDISEINRRSFGDISPP